MTHSSNPNQELIDLLLKRREQAMQILRPAFGTFTQEGQLLDKILFLMFRAATKLSTNGE
jgi:hypothetical protein